MLRATLFKSRFRRVAALVGVGLIVPSFCAPRAHAIIGGCAGDPVVILSNGDSLDLNTFVSDSLSDVRQISYTVHVPAGVSEVVVLSLGPTETLRVVDDNPPRTYDTMTWVDTATTGVGATATTTIVSPLGLPLGLLGAGSDSGTDHTPLKAHVTV
jgi:hypothetical protein